MSRINPSVRALIGCLVAGSLFLGACTAGGDDGVTCAREEVVLEDGLAVTDIRCGPGPVAERGMTATVDYEAELADGSEINTGAGDADEYTFRLGAGQVVAAWDIGLVGMSVGGTRRIEAPPEFAYGEAGLFPDVPPNAAVTFEVELLDLEEPPE